MTAFALTLGIEATDLDQFFTILSANGSRNVDLETFVVGCIKLRGMAKSMDVLECVLAQRQTQQDLHSFMTYCRRQFQVLRACTRLSSTYHGLPQTTVSHTTERDVKMETDNMALETLPGRSLESQPCCLPGLETSWQDDGLGGESCASVQGRANSYSLNPERTWV